MLGWAGPTCATGPKVEMVPASAMDTTTGGFHALVPRTGKAVHSALGTYCTVYSDVVGDIHLAPIPGSRLTTQDTELDICHTAPMPGSQTPIWDIDSGICHTAVLPSSQPLILSCGFICGTGKEMPSAPGTFGTLLQWCGW
ncbi:hypothetical protein E2C01_001812 [Portunus trituberculatus]|uniref:Uncharacterized protein n=1 Tax=Portunus trituberculatus TaxID=210409 RepID=A0A5B7CI94_PORTR|nr:hypothetical protein [Portunus trituberculatus]